MAFLVDVRLKRRGVAWSLLVVMLTTIRHTRGLCNSLWTWFYSHIQKNLVGGTLFMLYLLAILRYSVSKHIFLSLKYKQHAILLNRIGFEYILY